MIYAFEDAEVDTNAFELRVGGERVPVEPQVFEVLRYLIDVRVSYVCAPKSSTRFGATGSFRTVPWPLESQRRELQSVTMAGHNESSEPCMAVACSSSPRSQPHMDANPAHSWNPSISYTK